MLRLVLQTQRRKASTTRWPLTCATWSPSTTSWRSCSWGPTGVQTALPLQLCHTRRPVLLLSEHCQTTSFALPRGLLYCMEYLEENLDEWLGEELTVRTCLPRGFKVTGVGQPVGCLLGQQEHQPTGRPCATCAWPEVF